MTAEQQAAEALDREWQHALSSRLPPRRPCLADHAAVLQHHRCARSLAELLNYYSRKLPAHLFGPQLIAAGQQLIERGEHGLAASLCFQRLADLNLPSAPPDSSRKLDAAARLALHVQALYGLHECQAAEALRNDSQLQHQHTVAAALAALAGLQAACEQVVPSQPQLVHAGTQRIHSIAAKLAACGRLHAQVLPHLLFATRAMESHVSLCSPAHLPWRVQLYAAAAECYHVMLVNGSSGGGAATDTQQQQPQLDSTSGAAGDVATSATAEAARAALAGGIEQLARIAHAQALDAVPAPEVSAAVQAAQAQLVLLQCLVEQPQQQVAPLSTAAAAAPALAGTGKPPAAAGAALLSSIKAIGSMHEQLAALLRLLQAGLAAHHQCPLRKVSLPASLQPVMAAAWELAGPVLLDPDGAQPAASAATAEACAKLHLDLMCAAYRYDQQAALQGLLSAALNRADSAGPAGSASPDHSADTGSSSSSLVAAAAVLDAVAELQAGAGDHNMQHLAAVLAQHSHTLGACMPQLLAAAALELLLAADALLQGCFGLADGNAPLVQAVLEGAHAALQQSGHADGIVRGSVALRLSALLEEQQQLVRGLTVVQEGLAAIVRARSEALTHLQGQPDEPLRWISGSRTQPDDAAAALLRGMSNTEQQLACLHADAIMLRTRLQLKQGLREAAAKASLRQQRMQATLQKRDEQAAIFGARTHKERRLDALAVESAASPSAQAACGAEQKLLLECGRCPYQRALVLTCAAQMQPDTSRQAALLEEACDALQSAHAAEAELFASQQPSKDALRPISAHQHMRPINPNILSRTPNSIALAPFPVPVPRDAQRQPAAFAAFCKPCAAGVSLTVNKTAAELPGSGVQVPLGSRVTIEGLQENEEYVFAVAVYDSQGVQIGELGASSSPVVISLPLPVHYCYAQVLLTAAHLGVWAVAKRAASALFPRFFTATAARPLWQAHPADRHSLQTEQVAAQVPAFLRLLAQAVYAHAGHQATKQLAVLSAGCGAGGGCGDVSSSQDDAGTGASSSGSALAGTAASRALLLSLSESHVEQQCALLECAKRHLLAMEVAAMAGAELLVELGAVRAFNVLSPLLQRHDVSPTLFQPLSELHALLAAVRDTAASTIAGHRQQRQSAAQVLAAAAFWKLRLLQPVSPDTAAGSSCVAACGVLGLQLQPSQALAALDGALLRALGGSVASTSSTAPAAAGQEATYLGSTAKPGKGGGAGKKQHKQGHKAAAADTAAAATSSAQAAGAATEEAAELVALHELLLWHPSGPGWAADLHARRCGDPADLVAQVLPKLQQPHALTTCWPLLAAPEAQQHLKWLPLCVLLMQAAAKQHGAELWLSLPPPDKAAAVMPQAAFAGVAADSLPPAARPPASPQLAAAAAAALELLQAVKQHVRLAARRPQFLAWPRQPKWSVDAAAAALEAQGFVLGDQGSSAALPQPELPAGAAADAKAAALSAWQQQSAELLATERRRVAAAQLLQQRLPVLLGRRRAILAARSQLAAWAPWLSQLHSITAGLAAEAAAQLLALNAPCTAVSGSHTEVASTTDAAVAPETAVTDGSSVPVSCPSDGVQAGAAGSAADGSVQASSRPVSPRKADADAAPAQATQQAAPSAAAGASSNAVEAAAQQLALQAHQQYAQAATLAARGRAHQQLFSVSKQLQGASLYLLNKLPALLLPVPAVRWGLGPLPEPLVPPLLATAPERSSADANAAGAAAAAAAAGSKAAPGAAKKPAAGASAGKPGKQAAGGTPRADAKHMLLPEPQCQHVGLPLKAVAAALLTALQDLRSRASASASTAALPGSSSSSSSSSQQQPLLPSDAPMTARSNVSAATAQSAVASVFSFGSDAVTECWHTRAGSGGVSGLDVRSLTQVAAVVLKALHRMERWSCMLRLGSAWLDVCQGSADAALVPLLLSAATRAGCHHAADVAALTAAQQALKGDQNAALVELDRVRHLVAERLGGLPPLDACTGAGSSDPADSGLLGRNTQDCCSSSTWRSAAACASDEQELLTAEYDRVVGQLTKRGEKGHMILALSELGDLHAHFGHWLQATEAWCSAADALLGPYHVVHTWQHKLQLGSPRQLLGRYGVHGLLLAVTLLGKLARYSPAQLGTRLSCALLAAELLPAVFAGDIVHPQRRVDFAAYVPVELWSGADVFDDTRRCNAAALASSLECLSAILQEQQLHLLTLPLLALWEHTSLYVTHDRASTVLSRITRVRALTALGLMPQAAAVLSGVMQGCHLPGLILGPSQPLIGPDGVAVSAGLSKHATAANLTKDAAAGPAAAAAGGADDAARSVGGGCQHVYHAGRQPGHPSNAAFLQYVAEAEVEPAVAGSYGAWLCAHLTLARASFLAAAGAAVDCWVHSKPSDIAAALKAGPPAAMSAEASDGVGNSEAAGAAAAVSLSVAAQGGKPAAGAQAATAAAGKSTAAGSGTAAAAAAAVSIPQVGAAELKLLAAAARLLEGVVATSCSAAGMSAHALGIPWADASTASPGVPAGHHHQAPAAKGYGATSKDKASSTTAKSSHSPGKAGKTGGSVAKLGKGGAGKVRSSTTQQQHQEQQEGLDADSALAERRAAAAAELLAAQHQQVLIQALLQLAAVQAARWLPLQVLPVCLAACEALKQAFGSGSSSGGGGVTGLSSIESGQAEAKAALQPGCGTWLAARLQLAAVLLQLNHHTSCASVCVKALTDAARAGDVAWSARLLALQAAALAAQEDLIGALNCYRTALARLEDHKLPACLQLALRQDYAALCDEVGARGDFDRLSGACLAASAAQVAELGLCEMMEHPQLTNIYMPATATHLTALLQAGAAATRRRQLVTAERHLRAAAELLACCRCLPVHAAAVLTGLARVLRLQAALQLPDATLIGGAAKATTTTSSSASRGGSMSLELQQQRLREAAHLLRLSLQVLVLDGGSPVLVRSALLELAAVLVQGQHDNSGGSSCSSQPGAAAAGVAAVLKAAHVTASHVCKLYLDSHSLQPVQNSTSCLPEWLMELLRGHEQLQTGIQQEAAAAAAAIAAGSNDAVCGGNSHTTSTSSRSSSSTAVTAGKTQPPAAGSTAPAVANASGLPAVSDATLGRLAVCFYVQQLSAMATGAAGMQQQMRAAEQALSVQPVLRAACARFAADCCWHDVPPEVAAALQQQHLGTVTPAAPLAPLPTGTVALQWYRQDGCWQVPCSWSCVGALPPSGQLGPEALHALPRQQPCVSCLYALVMPPALDATATAATAAAVSSAAPVGAVAVQSSAPPLMLQGELVLSLERVKRVQLQVKGMRSRLERPGKPTDLFAQPAPSASELAAVKHSVECLLAGTPEDELPPAPADLPPPLTVQQAVNNSLSTSAAGAAGAVAASNQAAGTAAASAAGSKGGDASVAGVASGKPMAKGLAGAAAASAPTAAVKGGGAAGSTAVDPASLELDWRQPQTWGKLEMLMDLEAGLVTADAAVAAWLGRVLLQGGTCPAELD